MCISVEGEIYKQNDRGKENEGREREECQSHKLKINEIKLHITPVL